MSDSKVVIVDYQLGNMFSVRHACRHVGMNVDISSDPQIVRSAKALILPGVGAFREAMEHMGRLGLVDVVKDSVAEGKPLFGVCLGLQLLFSSSEEFGETAGLGIIPGKVQKFPVADAAGAKIKIPQVGWNQIRPPVDDCWHDTPLQVCSTGDYMYFVHSFIGVPDNEENVLCRTSYCGGDYCSAVRSGDNVIATQFHPEKSSEKGLQIYANWARRHQLI